MTNETIINPATGGPITDVAVYGYRWFQRTYGNIYHTVLVFADGVELFRSEKMTYGYDDQYQETAWRALLAAVGADVDAVVREYGTAARFYRKLGIDYTAKAFDVKRKRDLFEFAPFATPSSER